jgi:hypothetical protein
MGALDFMWNAAQSGQIDQLEKRIKQLEERTEILYEWVQYLKAQLEEKQ